MVSAPPGERYRIRDIQVDVRGASIWRGTTRIVVPPRSFELLVALVRRFPDTVRRHELMESVWPDALISDQTLSHRVMVLRRALGQSPDESTYIAGERGFGYRLVGPVERVGEGEGRSVLPKRWWLLPGAAALLLLLSALAHVGSRRLPSPEGRDPATVALRPNLGVRGPLQPVAAEIARSIARGIRRSGGLRLVDGNGADGTARLRIEAVATGSAQAMELRLWLVEPGTGRPLWTRVLRGDAMGVLGREGAAVAATVNAVRQQVGLPEWAASELSPQLRRLCLRGELGWLAWTARGLRVSSMAWEKAVAIDPGCAPAHAGWSLTESIAALLGYRPPGEAEPHARELAGRAREIDPALGAGQLAEALVRLLFDRDPAGAERLVRQAAASDAGDPRAAIVLALALRAQGRFEEGLQPLALAAERDPYSAGVRFVEAWMLQAAKRWGEAAAVYRQALALEPELTLARRNHAECLAGARRPAEALLALGEGPVAEGVVPEAALRRAWQRRCRAATAGPEETLRTCLSAGDLARAAAALGAGLEGGWPFVVFVPHDPSTAPLGGSSAYRALLAQLGSGAAREPLSAGR